MQARRYTQTINPSHRWWRRLHSRNGRSTPVVQLRSVATRVLAVLVLVAGALDATPSAGAGNRIVEYTLPAANSGPASIVVGPDGALWFTEFHRARIGRIDRRGHVT